jgi:hypothetical protein
MAVLNARCVKLNKRAGEDRIESVEIVDRAGQRKTIRAEWFVLATGGIETTRLLLASDPQGPDSRGSLWSLNAAVGNASFEASGSYGLRCALTPSAIRFETHFKVSDISMAKRKDGRPLRNGDHTKLRSIVAELVELHVDVLVSEATVAKQATNQSPLFLPQWEIL